MRTDDNSVFGSLQQVAGVRYNHAEHNRDIIDTYVLRKAREKGVRLPTGGPPEEYKYLGAWVEPSTAGTSRNVVYIDVGSMYPSMILSQNASPETVIGTQADLDASQYTEADCVWGYIDPRAVKHLDKGEDWQQYTTGQYKMVYDPHAPSKKWSCDAAGGPQFERLYFLDHDTQKGFLTECVEELIDLKNKYRGTSLYGSTKRVTNSIYGVLGFATEDSSFRLFDWRIAESITLSGRKMIQYSRDYVLDYLHERGYEDAYAALGDTDGVGIAIPTASTRHEALSVVEDAVAQLNGPGYDEFFVEQFNVSPDAHHGEIEVESYAPKVFIPSRNPPHGDVGVKKRRIEWQSWDEDDGNIDDISITGLEATRSDIAPVTREAQEAFAETLRLDDSEARRQLFPTLRELAQSIESGDIDLTRVCKRGGIGQDLADYGTDARRAGPLYRGAKYANEHIEGTTIQRGDKPAVVYVDSVLGDDYSSTYSAETAEDGDVVDAVSLVDPARLPDAFQVDWGRHLSKSLIEPLRPLLETRFGGNAWSEIRHQHKQVGFDSF